MEFSENYILSELYYQKKLLQAFFYLIYHSNLYFNPL